MEFVTLKATPRTPNKGLTNRIRREGRLPVVLYGQGIESRALQVSLSNVERILRTGAGRNSLIRLEVEGESADAAATVIIRDLQSDARLGRYTHADLLRVSLKEKIKASVRLVFSGEDDIARLGGIVQHQMREVEVEALPTDLPDHITVDFAGRGIGDTVTVSDLTPPAEVVILSEPDSVVASIVALKAVGQDESAEGEDGEAGQAEGEGAPAKE